MNLAQKKCIPCQGGVPALPEAEKRNLLKELHPDWTFAVEMTRLRRQVKTKGMAPAMELANKIAQVADEQWHHPELGIGFGHLDIEIWTHKINNLVESDFIFAAKVDKILDQVGA